MFSKINTEKAPNSIGPYVQGVDLGNIIITSGQIPINPANGMINEHISNQTNQTLENIKAIIEAAGLKVSNIVKTTVFLKNLNDIKIVNLIYENFFLKNKANLPARSCVEVARLPKDAKIEIEAIAIRF
ncbi:MAG: reactive intermediate/imine deaminase [Pantoea sp. Brub]|nr:reactive intermediate/imine deaminase [Pantoea sp. Brub]